MLMNKVLFLVYSLVLGNVVFADTVDHFLKNPPKAIIKNKVLKLPMDLPKLNVETYWKAPRVPSYLLPDLDINAFLVRKGKSIGKVFYNKRNFKDAIHLNEKDIDDENGRIESLSIQTKKILEEDLDQIAINLCIYKGAENLNRLNEMIIRLRAIDSSDLVHEIGIFSIKPSDFDGQKAMLLVNIQKVKNIWCLQLKAKPLETADIADPIHPGKLKFFK